ncbi:ABC transporter [Candidatus Daviesbacteria bacterium RIFCSPHIGHO2_12_FULL_37_11]|uniref:ABC transporter n=1 Tax=Candidatus Daviesbacteria bacterium RIFCSPHIGHO2_12_FULL_37_11 TaxID=1797777 RepID=A0A1F5K944_9BACT|nr:MAG: ABC transporter [Candidatus Daviesbacteria bacterium RIFCSPHIGHO2_01_FULL_37_27]OGE37436.1 MAG: ABC transporter [Candidatus Daviesbacteria bacterium RIFCSPHIGHO2_12_FULL_37_11]
MSIISVKNLKKYYSVHKKEPGVLSSIRSLINRKYIDVKAVDGISFDINEGELVGFIGPNGAGKTTTLKVLSGLLYPTSGNVRVLGHEPFKRQADFQKQFSLVMGQKNQLWWDLPPWESFILNKEIYEVSNEKFNAVVDELAIMLEVEDILKIQVRKLSLGQRMKCELIASLIHSPRVLFLDEPTIGLDVVAQKNMRDFIKNYNNKYNATVILTSHYMGDVKELCKRVIIIDKGIILYDGLLSDIVEKFAPHKLINVDFEKEVEEEKLKSIGEVKEFNSIHALIHVPGKEAAKRAGKLLDNFPVADLTIEEPPIEDIIREVFSGGKI